ncbi:MAG: adenosylcobinamide-phosphate synthase CbiB [Pseudomonadota bacterium]|nr:adenosylcobinamide-phosphate synthase CbiB [Pseudomonadota bacterium]
MLAGLTPPALALLATLAVLADLALGEPRRWHPLVGFGRLAGALADRLNDGRARRGRGLVALGLLLGPPAALGVLLAGQGWANLIGLYLALGGRSLAAHAAPVQRALEAGELAPARQAVGRLVSRDAQRLDADGVARATVESVLENGLDAVFASLFWFALAGLPGVLVHRLANTLDAMWGYRTARWAEFGWAAARLDDVLGYLPARLTALGHVLLGPHPGLAWRCWRRQAPGWPSPNAGPVMAAGAGALGVQLGGPAPYGEGWRQRPVLGAGAPAAATDIARALRLNGRVLAALLVALWGWAALSVLA